MLNFKKLFCLLAISCNFVACSAPGRYSQQYDSAPQRQVNIATIKNPTPKKEPLSRYGNSPSYEVYGKRYAVMPSAQGYKQRGVASWYGTKFHNHRTSSGEVYDVFGMTAAHKSLPLPTYVKVTNLKNGRQVIVRVNDRGPFHGDRLIDLSYVAAKKLGIVGYGTGLVEIEALSPGVPASQTPIPRSHKIYLQVGAFSQRFNAMKFAKKVADVTQKNVQVTEKQINSRPIFRIQLGPVASVSDSEALQQAIKQAGLGEPLVVVQ